MSKASNKNMKYIHKYFKKRRDSRDLPYFTFNNWKKMHGEVKAYNVQRRRALYGCVNHR